MMKTYRAPWGGRLVVISVLMVVFSLVSAGIAAMPEPGAKWRLAAAVLPVVLVGAAPFVVRGYWISGSEVGIRRLFWTTRYRRDGLVSAEAAPEAMRGCLRVCGNGGVFSFTGWYWSRALGIFHPYVTDVKRTVVLRFGNRTVVVSPEFPEDFVNELKG